MVSTKRIQVAGLAGALAFTPLLAASQAPPAGGNASGLDPAAVSFTLPDNIPWTGEPGRQQQYKILGDPAKPGPYIVLVKWWPGAFSRPHFHEHDRYITVISGIWWVSSSTHYDPSKTYPISPGTVVKHTANKVHWDGAKDVPAIIEIVGEGPADSISVDEQGRRLPGPGAAGVKRAELARPRPGLDENRGGVVNLPQRTRRAWRPEKRALGS